MDANVRDFILQHKGPVDVEANHGMTPHGNFRGIIVGYCAGRPHFYFTAAERPTATEAEADAAKEALALVFERAERLLIIAAAK